MSQNTAKEMLESILRNEKLRERNKEVNAQLGYSRIGRNNS